MRAELNIKKYKLKELPPSTPLSVVIKVLNMLNLHISIDYSDESHFSKMVQEFITKHPELVDEE